MNEELTGYLDQILNPRAFGIIAQMDYKWKAAPMPESLPGDCQSGFA